MKIDDIVSAINKEDNEGQAKEASDSSDSSKQGALASALSKIEEIGSTVKNAEKIDVSDSNADAVETLMKIASDLAGSEKEAEAAHAYLCGAAFADGAIAKFTAYDSAVKEAAANSSIDLLKEERERFAKVAETSVSKEAIYKQAREEIEQELTFKQAAEIGYADALNAINKIAKENKDKEDKDKKETNSKIPPQFLSNIMSKKKEDKDKKEDNNSSCKSAEDEGYNTALQQVHDLAVTEFLKGAAAAEIMVNRYREKQTQAQV